MVSKAAPRPQLLPLLVPRRIDAVLLVRLDVVEERAAAALHLIQQEVVAVTHWCPGYFLGAR